MYVTENQLARGMDEKKTSASSGSAAGDAQSQAKNNNNVPVDDAKPGDGPARANTAVAMPASAGPTLVEHSGGSWLCCVPCYWLRRNNSVHKASLTVATLLVTSLLVASPVLFLISAVPASETPSRDCRFLPSSNADDCLYALDAAAHGAGTLSLSAMLGPECTEPHCNSAAARIMTGLDRTADPCSDFRKYSCGRWRPETGGHSLGDLQAAVYMHLQLLLTNTTAGQYKKLGDFYRSCVKIGDRPVSMSPS